MMTQIQTAIATDEQAIAQQEFEKYISTQAEAIAPEVNFSFQSLPHATDTILRHALALASEKQKRSRTEYKKLLSDQDWQDEDKKYLKVAAAFGCFSPQDLAQIEPDTIFLLAKNSKKYQLNSGTNCITELKSNYEVKQPEPPVKEVAALSLPLEEKPLTSTQIARKRSGGVETRSEKMATRIWECDWS